MNELDRANQRILELEESILECQTMHDAGETDGEIVARLLTIFVGSAIVASRRAKSK